MPYHRAKKREVLVRKFDGQSWSTLPTTLRKGSEGHSSLPGGSPARVMYNTSYFKGILHYLTVMYLCSFLGSVNENIRTKFVLINIYSSERT